MTREDIIKLAREAELAEWHESIQQDGFSFAYPDRLERFAALVAEHEREACAKVCEDRDLGHGNREDAEARRCAKAIRARSDT